jgi:hypothetical protein
LGPGKTEVVSVEELFAESGSCSAAETAAPFASGPPAGARTVMLAVAIADGASPPRAQVTVAALAEQLPADALEDWYVDPDGNVSVSETELACAGPLLRAVSV